MDTDRAFLIVSRLWWYRSLVKEECRRPRGDNFVLILRDAEDLEQQLSEEKEVPDVVREGISEFLESFRNFVAASDKVYRNHLRTMMPVRENLWVALGRTPGSVN